MGRDPVGASAERYLETVYRLERSGNAIAARVAEQLGVSAPSVTQALRRLEAAGWLRVQADRSLHLTVRGARLAQQVQRRHCIVERWLAEGLGLSREAAHQEAQRLQHAVSTDIVDRIYDAIGRPTACYHGQTIPEATSPSADESPAPGSPAAPPRARPTGPQPVTPIPPSRPIRPGGGAIRPLPGDRHSG